MAYRTANPLARYNFTGPGYGGAGDLTAGLSSIAQALIAAPGIRDQAATAAAQRDSYVASTAKTRAETDALLAAQRGRESIAGLYGTFDPANPGGIAPDLASAGAYLPAAEQGTIADLFRFVTANSPATDAALGRAVVGSGQLIGVNDAVSLSDRESVAARNQANTMEERDAIESAETGRNRETIAGAMEREVYGQKQANARNQLDNETSRANNSENLAKSVVNVITGYNDNGAPILRQMSRSDYQALEPEDQLPVWDGGLASIIVDANKGERGNPQQVNPSDSGRFDAEIDAQTGNAQITPDDRTLIRATAERFYATGSTPTEAVKRALETLGAQKGMVGVWPFRSDSVTLPSRDAAPAPAAPASPSPAAQAAVPRAAGAGERRVDSRGRVWERGPDGRVYLVTQ